VRGPRASVDRAEVDLRVLQLSRTRNRVPDFSFLPDRHDSVPTALEQHLQSDRRGEMRLEDGYWVGLFPE
jgi:hypothetical protein